MASQEIKIVVVFSRGHHLSVEALVDAVSKVTDLPVNVYMSHNCLKRGIQQLPANEMIMVYHAADRKDLRFLHSVQDRVKAIKLILILSDRNSDTFSEGLLLRPRFTTHWNKNFSDVSAVLKKMLDHSGVEKNLLVHWKS